MIPESPTEPTEERIGAFPEPFVSSGLLVVDNTVALESATATSSVAALLRDHLPGVAEVVPRIDVVGTLADALALLNGGEYAAIVLELNLPDSSGLDTLDRVLAAHPSAPVIVLTGAVGDDLGREAVARGAADYLPREDLTGRLLLLSIRYAAERVGRRGVEARYRDLAEETARRQKRTFGALEDAVFTVDRATDTIVDCNPSAALMFAYSRDELVGQSAKILHVDEASYQRFREESVPSRTRYRMRRHGGTLIHAEVTVSLLHPERGLEAGVVVVMRDITERVERGRQLRFQAALLEQVGQPVLAFDDDGRITYWNRAAEEVTGMTRSEVVGRNAVELLSMEDDPEQSQTVRAIAESVGRWEGEVRIRTRDGSVATIQATATHAANADGSAGGRIATGMDITGLRRAEKASRHAAERLRRQAEMLEAVGQAVIGSDLEGRITYWNKAAAELYGWTGEQALGRKALGVTPSEASPEQAAEIFDVLREGKAWTGESNVRRADGSTFCALVTDSPMVDRYGRLIGIIGLSTDISERKEMEERMRQAAKMEAVGRLAGGVAHDFNNLLTAIEGNASLVLEELDPGSSMRNDIEEIRTVGRRAASLTRQLLAFSRKQVLEERRIDVGQATLELKAMLDRLVPARIEFRVEAGAEDLVVRVDPTQLQQVVMNLVVNAIDATRDGGTVLVRTDSVELSARDAEAVPGQLEPGCYVRLRVQDSGTGVPANVMEHIFEPFFTTKGKGRGTGLGLSTVYGIVKQSGGHVLVDSGPDRGTTFDVLLPRTFEEADKPRESPRTAPATKGGLILLVEDELSVRNIIRRLLERRGYTVLEAASGREALHIAGSASPGIDLVISDVVMPVMGGVELQARLREDHPDVRVILTSGYSEADVRRDVPASGVAFLAKPFTAEALYRTVAEALAPVT